ncbi:MAG: ComEA family DNA-binding protein [Chlamydiota bacterium]|nr:ComEA family DNA-binding protein [Chlamydiota bacterium]
MLNLTRKERVVLWSLMLFFCLGMIILYVRRAHSFNWLWIYSQKYCRIGYSSADRKLFVLVKGEVVKPGIYEVPVGTRLKDVLKLAQPYAGISIDAYNPASFVYDGQTVVIMPKISRVQGSEDFKSIDINKADANELTQLPGIGPSIAERIVSFRTQHYFSDIQEIMQVPGIGKKRFEMIKDCISIENKRNESEMVTNTVSKGQ